MTTKQESKRILSVTVSREIDTDPDTSWMGEYSSKATSEYSIDRAHSLECFVNGGPEKAGGEDTDQDESEMCGCGESGDMERDGYRYFNPSNYVLEGTTPDGAAEVRNYYVRQDYERMESLNLGDWCFLGISAVARVQVNGDTVQRIHSGGLWGIESDSDDGFIEETEAEQLADLKAQLHAIGFTKRAIAAAFRNVEHKDA